jgi:hypothetical protein
METKICKKCKIEQDINNFTKESKRYEVRKSICKTCFKSYNKKSYEKTKDIHKEKRNNKCRLYREKNKDKINEAARKRYQKNKEKIKEYGKNYYKQNKERRKAYHDIYRKENRDALNKKKAQKFKDNHLLSLERVIRAGTNRFINKKNCGKKTLDILGCSYEYLTQHLENQFKEGMKWKNRGFYGWHIDHIIPLSSAKTEDELIKLCHYSNLQPLWAEENLKKSNKICQ